MSSQRTTVYTIVVDATQAEASMKQFQQTFPEASAVAKASAAEISRATNATRADILNLRVAQDQLREAMAQNRIEAARVAEQMNDLVAVGQKSSGTYKQLSQDAADLDIVYQKMQADLGALRAEQSAMTTQLQATNAAVNQQTEAYSLTTRQMVTTGAAVDRLAGVSIQGARGLGMLAGAISAGAIAQVALIAGIALLVGWLIQQIKYERELLDVKSSGMELDSRRLTGQERSQAMNRDLQAQIVAFERNYELYNKRIEENNEQYYKNQEAVRGNFSAGEQWLAMVENQITFGLWHSDILGKETDKLVELNNKTAEANKKVEEQIEVWRKAITVGDISIGKILEQVKANTELAKSYEYIQRELNPVIAMQELFNKQMNDLKLSVTPSIKETSEGIKALGAELKTQLDVEKQTNQFKSFDDVVRSFGSTLTVLSKAVKDGIVSLSAFDPEIQKMITRWNQLNVSHKAAEAQLRRTETAAAELADKVAKAQAQLQTEKFGKFFVQGITESADITKLEERMRIEKTLTASAMKEIETLRIASAQRAVEGEIAAQQKAVEYITRLDAKANLDKWEAKQKQMVVEHDKALEYFKSLGLSQVDVQKNMIEADKAIDREYLDWYQREYDKTIDAATQHAIKMGEEETKARAEQALKLFQQNLKLEEDAEKEIRALNERFRQTGKPGQIIDIAQLHQAQAGLQQLGVTAADVDKQFGSQSKTVDQLLRRIAILKAELAGDWMTVLKLSIEDATESMSNQASAAKTLEESWKSAIDGITSDIESGFQQIVEGTMTFSQVMKKTLFDLIAVMAEYWAKYFLAMAMGIAFTHPAAAAAYLAAAAALFALAGVMHALAAAQTQQKTAATGTSGTTASGSTGTRAAVPPTEVAMPTTPVAPGAANIFGPTATTSVEATIVVEGPDVATFMRWLDGKSYIRVTNLQNGNQKRAVQNALGLAPG